MYSAVGTADLEFSQLFKGQTMTSSPRWRTWLSALAFVVVLVGVAAGADEAQQKLLAKSEFRAFKNSGGGAVEGAVLIQDGKIMHLNVKPPQQVGVASFDEQGRLVLTFSNHRKYGQSLAIVERAKPGHWEGTITQQNGVTSRFVLKRKKQ